MKGVRKLRRKRKIKYGWGSVLILLVILFAKGNLSTIKTQLNAPITSVTSTAKNLVQKNNQTKNTAQSSLASLNYTSGENAFVNVNNGKSTLSINSWKNNQVTYSALDSLNRTSTANIAYLEPRNLANDSLRERQYVEPTGWHQKYVNGEPIINRGHLIAYSLSKGISTDGQYIPSLQSGDQNNLKNLFTQTAFSNQKIQTIYESKVRNALKEGHKVVFEAHAIFRGNELMARGVQLQAVSDDGSLNFNVYIFNVQPGVSFDYATGRSKVDTNMKVPTPANAPSFNE